MVDILLTCSDVKPLQFCLYINFLSWFPSIKRFFPFLFFFFWLVLLLLLFFFHFRFFSWKERKKKTKYTWEGSNRPKVCMITRYDELLNFINISIKPPPSFWSVLKGKGQSWINRYPDFWNCLWPLRGLIRIQIIYNFFCHLLSLLFICFCVIPPRLHDHLMIFRGWAKFWASDMLSPKKGSQLFNPLLRFNSLYFKLPIYNEKGDPDPVSRMNLRIHALLITRE